MTAGFGALLLGFGVPRRRGQPVRRDTHRAEHHLQRGLAASGGEPVPFRAARGGRDACPTELLRLMGYDRGAYALGYIDDLRDPIEAVRPGLGSTGFGVSSQRNVAKGSVVRRHGRHYRGRHAGRDPSGHRHRLRRPLRGLQPYRQRGRGFPAKGTGDPGRVQRVLDRALLGRLRGQVRWIPHRRVVHQAELRRAGGPHRQRGLLRARPLPGHRCRARPGAALAGRGPAARLRRHALQPRLRVEPGPRHVRQARLRRDRADSRCGRGRGCADLLAQPGGRCRRERGLRRHRRARRASTWPWSACTGHPTTTSTPRWWRPSPRPTRSSAPPAGAGPSSWPPRGSTSAPASTSAPTRDRTSPSSTPRRCGSSLPRCPSWRRSRARPSGAGAGWRSPPTSGWPRRRRASRPTSPGSGFHHGFALSVTLPAAVGRQAAADLLLTGRRVGGEEALALGLCDRLAARGRRRAAGGGARPTPGSWPPRARWPPAPSGPPCARAWWTRSRAAMAHECAQQLALAGTADFAEGVRATAERRPPHFSGT